VDEQPGQDGVWILGTRQLGQVTCMDSRDKTIGTGHPGQVTWTGLRAQNGQNMTARTKLLGQGFRDRTARTRQTDRTARTWQFRGNRITGDKSAGIGQLGQGQTRQDS
jgi:hypothetical protein